MATAKRRPIEPESLKNPPFIPPKLHKIQIGERYQVHRALITISKSSSLSPDRFPHPPAFLIDNLAAFCYWSFRFGIPYTKYPLRAAEVMVLLKERLPTGFSPPLSIAQEVSRFLENKIILNELKPGSRLVERNLAESLGVSRISIREAFRILELAGLVKIIPRKGAQVTAITEQEIEEIYTLRAYLVGLSAKLAARNIKREALTRLINLGKKMTEKSQKNDLKSYFQLNLKFHRLLRHAGGNQKLHQILENFGKQTHRFRYASLSLPGRMRKSNAYHQRLIEALRERNEEKAEKIARTIIEEAKQALIEHPFDESSNFRELFKRTSSGPP